MGVGRHVMLSIVGFLCICAICYNLGSIQLQMESTLIEGAIYLASVPKMWSCEPYIIMPHAHTDFCGDSASRANE